MLLLTRRRGETLMIGDDVTVTVIETQGQQVRLGIRAPAHIGIMREALHHKILTEKRATASSATACTRVMSLAKTVTDTIDACLSKEKL